MLLMNSKCHKQNGLVTLKHWFSSWKASWCFSTSYKLGRWLVPEDLCLMPLGCRCNSRDVRGLSEQSMCLIRPSWARFATTDWMLDNHCVWHHWMPGTIWACLQWARQHARPASNGHQWCSLLRAGSPCIRLTAGSAFGSECYVAVNMAPNHGAGGVCVTDWAVTSMDKNITKNWCGVFQWNSHVPVIPARHHPAHRHPPVVPVCSKHHVKGPIS